MSPSILSGSGGAPVHARHASTRLLLLGGMILSAMMSIAAGAYGSLPDGWRSGDVGDVGQAGSTQYDETTNSFLITAAGAGLKVGGADHFHWAYQPVTGDFDFTVDVTDLGSLGQLGLMVREGMDADSRFKMLYVTPPDPSPRTDGRNTGSIYVQPGGFDDFFKPMPLTLRITRYTDKLALYVVDEVPGTPPRIRDWATLRGLGDTLYIGMAVMSGNNNTTTTATFSNASVKPLELTYRTSWIGNSYAGAYYSVQREVESMFVHPDTGRIYLHSTYDEMHKNLGIHAVEDGDQLSSVRRVFRTRGSGFGVAATSSHIYGTSSHGGDFYVFRTDLVGEPARIPNPDDGSFLRKINASDHVRGLAASEQAGEVYVSNTAGHEIQVYDLSLGLLRSFAAASPESIAVDPSGDLWVVERASDGSARIVRYAPDGRLRPQQITDVHTPRGLAIAPDGKLWVAEHGPKSQLLIFNPDGSYHGSFGAEGGIYSTFDNTRPGQTHPLKFNGPVGVGFDAVGNVIVSANPSHGHSFTTEVRKFTPQGELLWERYALDWMDVAAPDKRSDGEFVYTATTRYSIEYTQPTGQEWSYAAYTLDPNAYPDDPRIHTRTTGAYVQHIDDQKFLYVTTMHGQMIAVYRFDDDSDIAVPAFMIQQQGSGTRPATSPAGSSWVWRDADGNGQFDAGEFDSYNNPEVWQWFVDDHGHLWSATKARTNAITRWTHEGVDEHGVPRFDAAHAMSFDLPNDFTQASRLFYDAEADTMYLGGYTSELPREGREWKQFGRLVLRYDNWLEGNREASLSIELPYLPRMEPGHDTYAAQNLWVAGDLIFVSISATGEVLGYDKDTGEQLIHLVPGPEVEAATGLIDLTYGLNAFQRADGEYVVFVEANDQAKILMYRFDASLIPEPGSLGLLGLGGLALLRRREASHEPRPLRWR